MANEGRVMGLLDFDEATFSKYRTIGSRHGQLIRITDDLPVSFSTIYLIARLSDDELSDALAEGHIHQNVTRREIEAWLKSRSTRTKRTKKPSEKAQARLEAAKAKYECRRALLEAKTAEANAALAMFGVDISNDDRAGLVTALDSGRFQEAENIRVRTGVSWDVLLRPSRDPLPVVAEDEVPSPLESESIAA
jgi:hypothetical protein